ncbi:hypothetical protein GNI_131750, partial [Gregarina niphandrodes]
MLGKCLVSSNASVRIKLNDEGPPVVGILAVQRTTEQRTTEQRASVPRSTQSTVAQVSLWRVVCGAKELWSLRDVRMPRLSGAVVEVSIGDREASCQFDDPEDASIFYDFLRGHSVDAPQSVTLLSAGRQAAPDAASPLAVHPVTSEEDSGLGPVCQLAGTGQLVSPSAFNSPSEEVATENSLAAADIAVSPAGMNLADMNPAGMNLADMNPAEMNPAETTPVSGESLTLSPVSMNNVADFIALLRDASATIYNTTPIREELTPLMAAFLKQEWLGHLWKEERRIRLGLLDLTDDPEYPNRLSELLVRIINVGCRTSAVSLMSHDPDCVEAYLSYYYRGLDYQGLDYWGLDQSVLATQRNNSPQTAACAEGISQVGMNMTTMLVAGPAADSSLVVNDFSSQFARDYAGASDDDNSGGEDSDTGKDPGTGEGSGSDRGGERTGKTGTSCSRVAGFRSVAQLCLKPNACFRTELGLDPFAVLLSDENMEGCLRTLESSPQGLPRADFLGYWRDTVSFEGEALLNECVQSGRTRKMIKMSAVLSARIMYLRDVVLPRFLEDQVIQKATLTSAALQALIWWSLIND